MKKWIAVILVAVQLFAVTACVGTSSVPAPVPDAPIVPAPATAPPAPEQVPEPEPPAPEPEPITITHWCWADNTDYSAAMLEMAIDFNTTNDKKITVVVEEYPWDSGAYFQNLFAAAAGGNGPDSSTWKLTATPQFVTNNLLASLDEYISSWADKSQIEDNLYATMRQAGGGDKTYAMPWSTQVYYVYYRPSVFAAAGVSVPQTYDEFLTVCTKLTGNGVYGFGMSGGSGGHEPWGSFIQARGGTFNDFTTPEAIQGMEDYLGLFKNGYAPPTTPTDGLSEMLAGFQSGTTAMIMHHIGSSAGMIETLGDDVDAFPFPSGVNRWAFMDETENVILESSQNKDAAFEWLAYLATGKGQEIWCTATGNVPVAQRVKALPYFQENRFMKASIESAPYAGIYPIRDTTAEWVGNIWPSTIAGALAGQISATEAMTILQQGLYE